MRTTRSRRHYGMGSSPGIVQFLVLAATVAPVAACSDGSPDAARLPDLQAQGAGATPAEKSIAFYVGRDLTRDGSVLLGGFGHEPSSHWIEITPARTFPPGTTLEVGVTSGARLPGERTSIPQEGRTARFVTSNYSEFAGFPPPLTNGGLNEHGVAARTVWSPSRPELVAMTPDPQRGLSYSDLARAVMERATSAREAAGLVGTLVEAHGYATYGGNSFLFADSEEGWVVITYAGGRGLWAAERLGPDRVKVLYPGYIGEIPLDFRAHPDFMGSENLIAFAREMGWFEPSGSGTMNLQEVYGRPFPSPRGMDDTAFRHPPDREEELLALSPVSLTDMMALVRDPRWSDDRAGYGQVAHLRPGLPGELGVLWVSVAPAVASPMVPIHVGAEDVPPEYKQHRYMTKGADATFLDPGFGPLEGTRSAYRTFRRLLYHTCARPEAFLKPVTAELEAFEARLLGQIGGLEAEAAARLRGSDPAGGRSLLTEWAGDGLLGALALGERVVDAVESEARERFGIPMPTRAPPEGATWRPESGPMMLPPEAVPAVDRVHCYRPGLDRYPRRHGSYRDLAGTLVR
jgi:dipeptidase